jgi:hypothetical protein
MNKRIKQPRLGQLGGQVPDSSNSSQAWLVYDHGRALRKYLTFGFIPDAGIASSYLRELFAVPATQQGEPAKLLVEIVADLTAGASEVAIPVSGGRDSRALLGAALQIFSSRQIHCVTFGSDGSADVEGARVACRSARVAHRVMDPDTFEWDLDALTGEMRRRLDAGAGVAPIDGMVAFGTIAASIPPELPVLSGFLGDATVGKHLKEDAVDEAQTKALDLFYSGNRATLREHSQSVSSEFLKAHQWLRQCWPGLTNFDLLDFGFRQRQRIRSSVSGSFANAVRPYEDRRWIAYWFSRPVETRLNLAEYDLVLGRDFPLIFGRMPLLSRIRRWRARARGRGAYRGDPQRNPSMAAALGEACRSFDRRELAIGKSAAAAFEDLMREPSLRVFRKVRWFATAELLARAQELPR